MLHTKFQGHRSIGSGEEDFLRFLPYLGMAAILVKWPGPFEQLFVPLAPGGYIVNLITIGPVVSEEKSFEIVDGPRRTTEPAYTISSPGAFGSGELKMPYMNQLHSEQPKLHRVLAVLSATGLKGILSVLLHWVCRAYRRADLWLATFVTLSLVFDKYFALALFLTLLHSEQPNSTEFGPFWLQQG